MNINQIRLLAVCLLATFVISGVVTTMGLITPVAAEQFGISVTDMASRFTWFTGGVFVGYIASFVIFDRMSIRTALYLSYGAAVVAFVLMHLLDDLSALAILFSVSGLAISVAVCGSGTLITQLWKDHARQTVIVAQDALFNGGGVVFSAMAAWFTARALPFSSTYLVVVGVILLVLVLAVLSDFRKDLLQEHDEDGPITTYWNAGIVIMGISLALFMLAKIAVFIWAPQFVVERFDGDGALAGQFMGNVFIAALIGSLAGTWLVSRVSVKILVYIYVCVSAFAVWQLLSVATVQSALLLAYVYGFSVSATFNAYVAFALTLVPKPSHRNIAYMLVMSSLGSSLAPLASSGMVEAGGEIAASLWFCVVVLLVVLGSLVAGELLGGRGAANDDF